MKCIPFVLFWSLGWHNSVFAQSVFQCPLCGVGKQVTIPDGVVSIPQNGDFTCQTLVNAAQRGGINQQTCALLGSFVKTPCGCKQVLSGNETARPTETPTMAPTFGAGPECYSNLTSVAQREAALSTVQVQLGRTYVLCPDTVYFMGTLDPSTSTFVDGFDAIVPRSNVFYKCGQSGSSANNCRLLGGTFAIISFGGDPVNNNVTFQGLTIESSTTGGVLAAIPGDLHFIDCIIKNQENDGPVQLLFAPSTGRRLSSADGELSVEKLFGLTNFDEVNGIGDEKDLKPTRRTEDRQLQGSQTATTLTVTFNQCVFEGNKLVSAGADSGIVQSASAETILVFEDTIFRNNDYGDSTLKSSACAILSRGPLTIVNSCFIDNAFVRDAPIITFGGNGLNASNNYVNHVDHSLICSFVVTYMDQTAWQAGNNFTCTGAEAASCQSSVPPVAPPQPTPVGIQPTRIPVPRVTLAPVEPPTNRPKGPAKSSSCAGNTIQVAVSLVVGLVYLI